MKYLLLILALLCLQMPAQADPTGTEALARKAITKAIRQHKPIKYYVRWTPKTLAYFQEKGDTYEGMQMAGRCVGDFMKNEPIHIIAEPGALRGGRSLSVTEEVIFPMFSPRNDAHVLRNFIIHRRVPVFKVRGKRAFTGLDLKAHTF